MSKPTRNRSLQTDEFTENDLLHHLLHFVGNLKSPLTPNIILEFIDYFMMLLYHCYEDIEQGGFGSWSHEHVSRVNRLKEKLTLLTHVCQITPSQMTVQDLQEFAAGTYDPRNIISEGEFFFIFSMN
jgi:hypothetical protein